MCFRPAAATAGKVACPMCGFENDINAPRCAECGFIVSAPGTPSAPGAPMAPGAPKAPGAPMAPGAPKASGAPKAPEA